MRSEKKYKAWIGLGNNGNLIKSLLKRRFWWSISEDKTKNINFMWTQLRNNDFMEKQEPSSLWVKNKSKVWGRDSYVQESKLSSKQLIYRRKKQSITGEQNEEDFYYKILTKDEILKIKEVNSRLKNKLYEEKKWVMELDEIDNEQCRMHNHLSNNFYLGNKKALFYNLKQYYELLDKNVFHKLPLTFHIKKGFKDIQYKRFVAYYKRRQANIKKAEKQEMEGKRKTRNIWIVKPG